MRKILLILTTILVLTSCVIESYDKPNKTAIGYSIASVASSDIRQSASLADIARVAEMWRNATTPQQRYEIEDRYFDSGVKIREYGDTIAIGELFKIKTFNKSLTETPWKVLADISNPKAVNYEVSIDASNTYIIKILNISSESLGEITVNVITPDREYSVSGNGCSANRDYYNPIFDKVSFEITRAIKFQFQGGQSVLSNWSSSYNPQDGEVNIEVYLGDIKIDSDDTLVKYLSQGMMILFRGFTDIY
jgi:hypothetical protein